MRFNRTRISLLTLACMTTVLGSAGAVAASAVAVTTVNPLSLGVSTNPAPASTGLGTTPSAMPAGVQVGPNGTVMTGTQPTGYTQTLLPSVNVAPPAWAQGQLVSATSVALRPFAANLFEGRFANTFSDAASPDYVLAPGDRVVVRVWGARTFDDVLVVDQQGNLFLPEVGPIHVGGVRQGNLLSTVRSAIARVYTDIMQVYVNLQSAQTVAV